MNHIEAINLMGNGDKIRCTFWDKGVYLTFNNHDSVAVGEKVLCWNNGDIYSPTGIELITDDWEIYEDKEK